MQSQYVPADSGTYCLLNRPDRPVASQESKFAKDRPPDEDRYTPDTDEHKQRVLELAQSLRSDGLTCYIDQFVNGSPPEGGHSGRNDRSRTLESCRWFALTPTYQDMRGERSRAKGYGERGRLPGSLLPQASIQEAAQPSRPS